ncbi:MAG TPA: C-GCAxxG-C-C family protein [Dissulfurispiraceae bacterium]|nr:C-GCAxxG-C-C family protein [Dissulfurispiraceae bacterium]
MTDEFMRMMELSQQGFHCSQIMMIIALEAQGRTNPDLVRAMSGLLGGVGFCGKICGTLTGGACMIGLYTGKGTPEEEPDNRLYLMMSELVEWFEKEYQSLYGGINCADILQDDPRNRLSRCPQMVMATIQKVREILSANDYDFTQGR